MYTTKSLVKSVLTLGLVAVLSSYGLAAGQSHEQMSDQPYQWGWGQQESYSSATDMRLGKASELIGSSLKNPQGQKLGTIYDLVLTEDLDNVSYVALSRGGLLGIGRNLYAVPWSAVQLGAAGNYILPVSEEEFMQWRGFRSSAWPDSVTRSWASEVSGTGEPVAHHGQMTEEKRPVQDRRATRIIGTTVKTPEGLTAGTIDDMVIALDDGEIQYVVVSFGGFLGLGEKFTVVPHDSIELDSDRRLARVNVGREVLREHSFAAGEFPDLGNPFYARNIERAYGIGGAGETVLGYVPAEEPAAGERMMASPAAMAAPTEADLTGTFDPAHIGTAEGTVTDLGKFKCSKTGMDILWLRIRTDDGQIVTAAVGPRKYIAGQDFYVVKGDRIRLTGSHVPAATAGKRVFLPTTITFGETILRLSDRSGRPLWESLSEEHEGPQPEATPYRPEQDTEDPSSGASHRS